jgi:hypothetical protein
MEGWGGEGAIWKDGRVDGGGRSYMEGRGGRGRKGAIWKDGGGGEGAIWKDGRVDGGGEGAIWKDGEGGVERELYGRMGGGKGRNITMYILVVLLQTNFPSPDTIHL